MKIWTILLLIGIAGCDTPEPAPDAAATTPTANAETTKTADIASTEITAAPINTATPEELAQRVFDEELASYKKWYGSEYGKEQTALNHPRLPGEPVAMTGSESSWPRDKHIAFVKVLKRQAEPSLPEGRERVQKMCAEGAARYEKLAQLPYAKTHPEKLPKLPEFDAEVLIKKHESHARNFYQYHLKQLAALDRYDAQEIETGIIVPAEVRAAYAAHNVDKKRLGNLRNDIRHHADALMPVYSHNDLQTKNLREWVQHAKNFYKRYAETMLFDETRLKLVREECREIEELVKRLEVSCERFEDRVPYGFPEPATYDAEALIAARAARFSTPVLEKLESGMAFYSTMAVRQAKAGRSVEEIVTAVEYELTTKHEDLLAERKTITETFQAAQQKFEQATTLDEMKTTVAEAKRIYDDQLMPNTRKIDLWRAHCHYLGFEELDKSGILPRESFPLNSMLIRVKNIEKQKLDVSDPAVRAKLPPIR